MIDPQGQNRLYVWDSNKLHIKKQITAPKTSSSVNTQKVKESRYGLYNDLRLSSSKSRQEFINYHSSHKPNKSSKSVCMHRDNANTVSLSCINVHGDKVRFTYADGSPCVTELGNEITMNLV